MAQVIAGIYELQKQIGSGGGGIVYLGRHLRLEKWVVLKADKRTLQTQSETLRREVDLLKGLSHTYIPQVYDFVQENGIVYTVMDFIDGESLDKILKRNQIPPQHQVIRWACQILEALSYLHSRPPYGILHGDIKPANIMLRPNGDICLIDYNIALALGEDGAVKVGYSLGYASPEHYGSENVFDRTRPAFDGKTIKIKTVMPKEEGQRSAALSDKSSSESRRGIMLDVRSDIYSLGATLYHLLSGKRPAQEAEKVEPLGSDSCSPAVAAIIQKAMAPSPDMRYQTAGEMLAAFRQLYKCDIRVIRHRRRIAVWTAILGTMFLAGGVSTFTGMKRLERTQEALVLAEYSANYLANGDVYEAVVQALLAMPAKESIVEPPVTPQAQKALTDALGVYDLSDDFTSLDIIKLPSAPFAIVKSPDNTCFAAVYEGEAAVFAMDSRKKLAVLPMQHSALSEAIFIDETNIIYAGEQGVTAFDLTEGKALWTGEEETTLAISGDRTVAAAVNRGKDYASIYRISDGKRIMECSFHGQYMKVAANDIFANPGDAIFSLNREGNLLAVSFLGGGLRVFDLQHPEEDLIIYETSDYEHFEGGFYGKYFAFAANKSDKSVFGLIDTEEGVYVGELESRSNFFLQAGEAGIHLANGNLLVSLDPNTLEEKELAYTNDVDITGFSVGDSYVLTATDNKGFSIFDSGANVFSSEICNTACDFTLIAGDYGIIANRNEPLVRLIKKESHGDTEIFSYDPHYVHDEARISLDGKTAMLFGYEGFCIYDTEGNLVKEAELPEPRNIYDQQFIKSEKDSWLEVTWYDGTIRHYSAADGTILREIRGEPPEKDLLEEFYTNQYRIESFLHRAPVVYDLKSGRKIAELEKEAYLTYVTQEEGYIITEYVSADGERYGILLDERLQTLAYLPGLCDVVEGKLVFDYGNGSLRQCRLYSLQELIALGENYIQNEKGKGERE